MAQTKTIIQPYVDFDKLDLLTDTEYLVAVNSFLTFEKGSRITDKAFELNIDINKIESRDKYYLLSLLKEREVLLRQVSRQELITNENNLNIPVQRIHEASSSILSEIDKKGLLSRSEKIQARKEIFKAITPILDEELGSVLVYPDPTKVSALFLYAVQQRYEIKNAIMDYAKTFINHVDFKVVETFLRNQNLRAKELGADTKTIRDSIFMANMFKRSQERNFIVFENIDTFPPTHDLSTLVKVNELADAIKSELSEKQKEQNVELFKTVTTNKNTLKVIEADSLANELAAGILATDPKVFKSTPRADVSKDELANFKEIEAKIINGEEITDEESIAFDNYLTKLTNEKEQDKTKIKSENLKEEILKTETFENENQKELYDELKEDILNFDKKEISELNETPINTETVKEEVTDEVITAGDKEVEVQKQDEMYDGIKKYNENGTISKEYIQKALKQIEVLPAAKMPIIKTANGKPIVIKQATGKQLLKNRKFVKNSIQKIAKKHNVKLNLIREGNTDFVPNKKFNLKIAKLLDVYGHQVYNHLPEGYDVKDILYRKQIADFAKKHKIIISPRPELNEEYKPTEKFLKKLKKKFGDKVGLYTLDVIVNRLNNLHTNKPNAVKESVKDIKDENEFILHNDGQTKNIENRQRKKLTRRKLQKSTTAIKEESDIVNENQTFNVKLSNKKTTIVQGINLFNESEVKKEEKPEAKKKPAKSKPKQPKRTAELQGLSNESFANIDQIAMATSYPNMQVFIATSLTPNSKRKDFDVEKEFKDLTQEEIKAKLTALIKEREQESLEKSKTDPTFLHSNIGNHTQNINKIIIDADSKYNFDAISPNNFNQNIYSAIQEEINQEISEIKEMATYLYADPKNTIDILMSSVSFGIHGKNLMTPILTEFMKNSNNQLIMEMLENQMKLGQSLNSDISKLKEAHKLAESILIKELDAKKVYVSDNKLENVNIKENNTNENTLQDEGMQR